MAPPKRGHSFFARFAAENPKIHGDKNSISPRIRLARCSISRSTTRSWHPPSLARMQVIRASCSGMWEWKTHARQVQSCNRKIRTPYSSPTASTLAGPARFRAAVLCPRATVPALSGVHSLAAGPAEIRSPPTGVRRAREHAEAGWVRPFEIAERPLCSPQNEDSLAH